MIEYTDSRWFEGFNDAAEAHILGSVDLLIEASEEATRRYGPGVAVQAGGCYGLYPYILAARHPVVVTFEPSIENMPRLQENLAGILEGEVVMLTVEAALGAAGGSSGMVIPHLNPGGSRLASDAPHVVPVVTLDAALPPEVEPVTLIQLDVEGSELGALAGAEGTIRKYWPVIMYEHCHDATGSVLGHLLGLGYQIFAENENDRVMVREKSE